MLADRGSCLVVAVLAVRLGFPVARALEYERDSMLILRHHRRPPSAPTALVQKIRQRVFVVARMS
jgi:hypothetical protein